MAQQVVGPPGLLTLLLRVSNAFPLIYTLKAHQMVFSFTLIWNVIFLSPFQLKSDFFNDFYIKARLVNNCSLPTDVKESQQFSLGAYLTLIALSAVNSAQEF